MAFLGLGSTSRPDVRCYCGAFGSSDGDEWLLPCPAIGIDLDSSSLLSGLIGLVVGLSIAVGAAACCGADVPASGSVVTGVVSLPALAVALLPVACVASLAVEAGDVVESIGVVIDG